MTAVSALVFASEAWFRVSSSAMALNGPPLPEGEGQGEGGKSDFIGAAASSSGLRPPSPLGPLDPHGEGCGGRSALIRSGFKTWQEAQIEAACAGFALRKQCPAAVKREIEDIESEYMGGRKLHWPAGAGQSECTTAGAIGEGSCVHKWQDQPIIRDNLFFCFSSRSCPFSMAEMS